MGGPSWVGRVEKKKGRELVWMLIVIGKKVAGMTKFTQEGKDKKFGKVS